MPSNLLDAPRLQAAMAPSGRPPEALRRHLGNPSVLLLVILTAQLMVVLDTTIVNVALPHIQRGLGFSASGLSWVLNAYILTFGGLLLLGARAVLAFSIHVRRGSSRGAGSSQRSETGLEETGLENNPETQKRQADRRYDPSKKKKQKIPKSILIHKSIYCWMKDGCLSLRDRGR